MNWDSLYAKHSTEMKQSMIREMVAQTKGVAGMISFAGGFPAPATFPKKELAELFKQVIETEGDDVLQYGPSDGDSILKQQIREWEGMPELEDDQILTTVGSTNGIYYYTRTFIDDGDVILCEGPNFLGTGILFETIGAEVVGIDMDEDGLIIDQMEERIKQLKADGKKIKFIYTIPEFQNPSGITMSLVRRRALIELAVKYEIPVLEDNPYGELRYSGEKSPSLYSIAQDEFSRPDLVVCVKSFSKVLGPGLRLAYAIGSKELIGKMVSWQQKVNVSADCVTQRVVARFMEKGLMSKHVKRLTDYYRPKRDKMLAELEKNMPEGVHWTKPDGGMFVWIYLPGYMSGDELFYKALDYKICFIPGSKFYPTGSGKYNEIRLNFSYPTLEEIEIGVKRLANLIREEMK